MEAKFSVLKGYTDCEISILNSKVDLFIESSKETTKTKNVKTTTWKFFYKIFVFYKRSSYQRTM